MPAPYYQPSPEFVTYFAGLRLPDFSPLEIAYRGASDEALRSNAEPPKSLWANIVKPLWLIQIARDQLGPLKITSGYRTRAYNAAVGGATGSQHLRFCALDVIPKAVSPRKLHDFLLALRQAGAFKGGLGLYSTFVHIDNRGANSTWSAT